MIAHFESKTEENWKGYVYSLGLFLVCVIKAITYNHHVCQLTEIGFCIRTSLICLICKKTLKLSSKGRAKYTTGEIVNLVSIDCQRFTDQLGNFGVIWGTPLQLAIGIYFLYNELGVAALFGLLWIAILVPLNLIGGYIATELNFSQLAAKDRRLKVD